MTRERREREGSEKGIEGEGKCQRGDAMVESHGLDEKRGFLENCEDL